MEQRLNSAEGKHGIAIGLLQLYQSKTVDLLERCKMNEKNVQSANTALAAANDQVILNLPSIIILHYLYT